MYECYNGIGRNRPAYSWAVNSLVVILMMHIFVFGFIFDLAEYLPYGAKFFILSEFRIALFIMAVYVLTVILINVYFKEKDVLSIEMGKMEKWRGYGILIVYVLLLIASIFILPFMGEGLM